MIKRVALSRLATVSGEHLMNVSLMILPWLGLTGGLNRFIFKLYLLIKHFSCSGDIEPDHTEFVETDCEGGGGGEKDVDVGIKVTFGCEEGGTIEILKV